MIKSWLRKYFFVTFSLFCSFLIFVFFVSHIFLGERSLWKIFELNNEIISAYKELNNLSIEQKNISNEINLLRDGQIDADLVNELSNDLLGLIQQDQIVIKISK
jgi:cell division protein FtsB